MDSFFTDALKSATTPVAFIMVVADEPLHEETGWEHEYALEQRDAIIAKARDLQLSADVWLPQVREALEEARRQLLGLSKQSRSEAIATLERLIDKMEKAGG